MSLEKPPPPALHERFPFCARCGGRIVWAVPEGDNRHRRMCPGCDQVFYENPQVVVGTVAFSGPRVLMCRRAIEPQRGLWTLPAGYLEAGESPADGARREAQEEACATLRLRGLLGVYTLTHINQVQLMFLGEVASDVAAGPESLEVALFTRDEIPDSDIAFATVRWALDYAYAVKDQSHWAVQERHKDARTPMAG